MNNPARHIKVFVCFYGITVLGYIIWLCLQHTLMSQIDPVLFINKPDFSKQLILLLGIPQAVVNNNNIALSLDAIFIILPLLLIYAAIYKTIFVPLLSAIQVLFNFVYCLCLSMVSTLSIEGFVAFVLVPIIFMARSNTMYSWLFRIIRYSFIILFFSTAIWKIRAGGLFNGEQMSAILRLQHASLLTSDTGGSFSTFITYLINHPTLSYWLYVLGFLFEFIFIIGLFTTRKDFILLILFMLFLIMDLFLMRINYFSWLPFAGLLYFSKFLPDYAVVPAASVRMSKPNPIR